MMRGFRVVTVVACSVALVACAALVAQEMHDHPAPEKLGVVSFPVSCKAGTQLEFDRGVALLHSFAYTVAESAFKSVAERDPQCAMAHWGVAMTHFHQLWEGLTPAAIPVGLAEIQQADEAQEGSERERAFIHALGLIYRDSATVPYRTRTMNYEIAMGNIAAANPKDVEAQVFYALALLAAESPFDKEHRNQKQAADLLEPLFQTHPDHPGIPHYLIHAYDNAEMAQRGLYAARVYAKIAPSAPHALHMPSHIFTRLGLWQDSIASNIAARNAAHHQGDLGEELHAMDYLMYAYLQAGHDDDAARLLQELRVMPGLKTDEFKVGYAATAMPVRYVIERKQWADAAKMAPLDGGALPQVAAIPVWAKGLGLARSGRSAETQAEIEELRRMEARLRVSGEDYWAAQVKIMMREVMAWSAQGQHKSEEAAATMRTAADEEDAIEKLPVTPGPIVPAREQLGDLLLQQGKADLAAAEFAAVLGNSPGRRGAMQGAAEAKQVSAQK